MQQIKSRLGNGQLVSRRCTIENQFDLSSVLFDMCKQTCGGEGQYV